MTMAPDGTPAERHGVSDYVAARGTAADAVPPGAAPTLSPAHRAQLEASGIAPEIIAARGYWTATAKRELADLGFAASQCRVPALVLPIHPVAGEPLHMVRPDNPRCGSDGRARKYEIPTGAALVLDAHPSARAWLDDPARPLAIVEGIKKADALVSRGLCAVALIGGCWGFRGRPRNARRDDPATHLADWRRIPLRGRRVYLVTDSDVMTNDGVHAALSELRAHLVRDRAEVQIVVPPHGPGGAKWGADDYLAAGHDLEDLLRLARAELPPRPGAEAGTTGHNLPGRALAPKAEEPWPEPVDGARLLGEIRAFCDRFVAHPPGNLEVIALYCVHAHALDCFDFAPRLILTSPEPACGKTETLKLIAGLCPRAEFASNWTAASIFRIVESIPPYPTLVLDEMDRMTEEARDACASILNSGHDRAGAIIKRVEEVGGTRIVKSFITWAPLVAAGIQRRWMTGTLESRSIVLECRKRGRGERIETTRTRSGNRRKAEEMTRLRRMAARWARDNAGRLEGADPDLPAPLVDRAADNWRGLIAVADLAGGSWPARAREVAVALSGRAAEPDPDREGAAGSVLLADLKGIFSVRGEPAALATEEILAALAALEERPWATWRNRGRDPIDAKGLARLLRPYGVRSKTVRTAEGTPKGYAAADLADPWGRYVTLPAATPPQSTAGGPTTPQTGESVPPQAPGCGGSDSGDYAGLPPATGQCGGVAGDGALGAGAPPPITPPEAPPVPGAVPQELLRTALYRMDRCPECREQPPSSPAGQELDSSLPPPIRPGNPALGPAAADPYASPLALPCLQHPPDPAGQAGQYWRVAGWSHWRCRECHPPATPEVVAAANWWPNRPEVGRT